MNTASLQSDTGDFLYIQTQSGWGKTLAAFLSWCKPQPGWKVLDAGCGPGLFPAMLDKVGCLAVGIDIDLNAFLPSPLHKNVAAADVLQLPFTPGSFDLITASNLLFLLPDPEAALKSLARQIGVGGRIALLNPSEKMNRNTAAAFADQRGLSGGARATFLNWASRAETHWRWNENDLNEIFSSVGLRLTETSLHIGEGLARFAKGEPHFSSYQ